MTIKLQIATEEGGVATIDVDPSATFDTVGETIAIELSVPTEEQELQFNGTPIPETATVAEMGLSDGDLILVSRNASGGISPQISNEGTLLQEIANNPRLMERLRDAFPALHRAVVNGDVDAFERLFTEMQQMGNDPFAPSEVHDPMSERGQRAIEERIRRQNVMDNMEAAIEHNPESFGSVVMLFVDCKINSVPNVKAFVDSGAQATIISKECAERCNILRLMDTRFQGLARGVGTARIHGRIHLALLTLESEVFEVSFTVMDSVGGGYDSLLGLDMLRKHQASIDLRNNCLHIGSVSVPFLPEKDIPLSMRQSYAQMGSHGQGSSSSSERSSGSSASDVSEESIAKLSELGFSRQQAVEALQACDGNTDQAATMLTQSRYGF